MSRWAEMFAALSREADTPDTSRHSAAGAGDMARSVHSVMPPSEPVTTEAWSDTAEERAAVVEYDGGIPRAWAEGFARLHPDRPPGDVPPKRWLIFLDDVGHFLCSRFCTAATALDWGPHDLFGCDRDRPFARIGCAGLLWLLNGDKLVALSENTATIERRTGARQTYRRKPSAPGQALAWELSGDG
jgi:hypothetical protein